MTDQQMSIAQALYNDKTAEMIRLYQTMKRDEDRRGVVSPFRQVWKRACEQQNGMLQMIQALGCTLEINPRLTGAPGEVVWFVRPK